MRDDEIAQFWHDDIRLVRDRNKTISRSDVNNLVSIWKTILGTSPSSLPIGNLDEERKSSLETTENSLPLRHRNKSQIILARKLQTLEEFANAYNLNLSNSDDTLLKTKTSYENVQRMAKDLLSSIDETNRINLGSFVTQYNHGRLSTPSRIQTLYQELLDVMPPKWKEVFEQQSV